MKVLIFAAFWLLSIVSPLVRPLMGNEMRGNENWSPDYLIIGAQKAGTTALFHYLNQHPQSLGQRREIHYFDSKFDKSKEWYQKQFPEKPSSEFVIGDKSPYYLIHPLVPERVKEAYPNVKIFIVLRNPVDRAYSQYWMNVRHGCEKISTFEEAVLAEKTRLENEESKLKSDPFYVSFNHRRFSYLARSRYVEQVKRWLEYFPREQIMFINAPDLRYHTQETMQKVFDFLGIGEFTVDLSMPVKHNDYPPIDPKVRQTLEAYFKPYNEALETLLDLKFNWNKS